jgi:hypothetical protein
MIERATLISDAFLFSPMATELRTAGPETMMDRHIIYIAVTLLSAYFLDQSENSFSS